MLLILCVGCSTIPRYNSKDLSILPCEYKERFFFPIEFNKNGQIVFKDQVEAINHRVKNKKPSKIYIFVHGWDKTAASAEKDYQDLICRFYQSVSEKAPLDPSSMVIGVFWNSNVFSNHSDPFLLKWATYFPIRNRAEILAKTGFQEFFELLQENYGLPSEKNFKLILIGHSFGGRVIIKALLEYISAINMVKYAFLSKIKEIRVVLLNAAVSEWQIIAKGIGRWDVDAPDMETILDQIFPTKKTSESPPSNQPTIGIRLLWKPSIIGLNSLTDFRIFNVYSESDYANRYLYPIGAIFNSDTIRCAIGGCGLSIFRTLRVNSGGDLIDLPNLNTTNVYNVDGSNIIHDHSDIYKGRVANLLSELSTIEGSPGEESMPGQEPKFSKGFNTLGSVKLSIEDFFYEQIEIDKKQMDQLFELKSQNSMSVSKFNETAFQVDDLLTHYEWDKAVDKLKDLINLGKELGWIPFWEIHIGLRKPGPEYRTGSWLDLRSAYDLLGILLLKLGRVEEAVEAYAAADSEWENLIGIQGMEFRHKQSIELGHPLFYRPMLNCHMLEYFANFVTEHCQAIKQEVGDEW